MLDMRTIVVGFVLSISLQFVIIVFLRQQHKTQYKGLTYWAFSYFLILLSFSSIALFDLYKTPSLIVCINIFSIGGLILLLFGLESFFSESLSWKSALVLFTIFTFTTLFFTYNFPNLKGRMISTAAVNFMIWAQVAWLIFYRVKDSFRALGCQVGIISLLLAATTVFRLLVNLRLQPGNIFYSIPDLMVWSFLIAQVLFFGFTFSLILMISKKLNQELTCDISKRKKIEIQLRESLNEIKVLRGIVPICSYCKKIRDDKGYWNQLEAYISSHSEAQFSHGICQECIKEHYPEEVHMILDRVQ